jgi:hypothetical protein
VAPERQQLPGSNSYQQTSTVSGEAQISNGEVRVPRTALGRLDAEELGVEVDDLLQVAGVQGELDS